MVAPTAIFSLLQLVTLSQGLSSETCSVPGWFGPGCVFKCHCRNDTHVTPCHQTTGKCAEGSWCEDGYSGTGCQYSDIAFGRKYSTTCRGNQKSSRDVQTYRGLCSTRSGLGQGNCSWSVNLTAPSIVSQIIIKFTPGTSDNNTWQVLCHYDGDNKPVPALRQFTSDNDTRITYLPPRNSLVSRVEVVATPQRDLRLCEVNVLGGRNMALKKNASQGEETLNVSSGAEKAVEDEGKRFYHGQCAVTKGRNPGQSLTSWWKVVLGHNVLAWKAEVHTHTDDSQVTLSLVSRNGSETELERVAGRPGMILAATDRPLQGTELLIKHKTKGYNLTLCEVRVLGDCLGGYFGPSCDRRCSCNDPNEDCDKIWGSCPKSGCQGQSQGQGCQEACPSGLYGSKCHETCSPNCAAGKCSHTDGSCVCRPGWTGDKCQHKCQGTFGINCTQKCPSQCQKTECHAETGECTHGCKDGWKGANCSQPCDVGYHGTNCSLRCLTNCHDNNCDRVNGTCSNGCRHGLKGSVCDTTNGQQMEPGKKNNTVVIVISIGIGIVVSSIVFMAALVLRRRRKTMVENRLLHSRGKSIPSGLDGVGVASRPLERLRLTRKQTADVSQVESLRREFPSAKKDSKDQKIKSCPAIKKLKQTKEICKEESANLSSAMKLSPAPPSDKESCSDSCDYSEVNEKAFHSNVTLVVEFPARFKRWMAEPHLFTEERSCLPDRKVAEWKTALLPENIRKSRYRDIYPYDHSRVVLEKLPGNPHSDFYNASYIDGYNKSKQYIAAQGPMERTIDDFLRMAWDVNCTCIVMLTNTVEMGRVKCHQYWPADGASLSTENVTLSLLNTTTFADFCVRDLVLERNDQIRLVKMFHYTAWPDNYAPSSPWSLLSFRRKVHEAASSKGPVIVHCSAGIGRSGTYLALDLLLSSAEQDKTVDVFACVWNLRQQRISMVQTLTQYIFIHEAIAAALVTSAPETVDQFRLSSWLEKDDGGTRICHEYQKLKKFLRVPGKDSSSTDNNDDSSTESLSSSSLLRGARRVSVFDVEKASTPVSVDAVFLSSYRLDRAFIQTHSPLDDGAIHFLSIVCQHHVTTIVCLDTAMEATQDAVYWPETEQASVTIGPYRVELLCVRTDKGLTTRSLRIHLPQLYDFITAESSQGEAKAWHDVTQVSCWYWPTSLLTSDGVSVLASLVNTAQPEPQGPVLVHCKDGRTRSGLFCVLSVVMERMRINSDIAISYITAHMSAPRGGIILSQNQYEFLFHFVQHEKDVMKGESPLPTLESPSESRDTTLADIWTI